MPYAQPTQVNVGYVLLSNSRNPIPSTRVAALNMFPFLRACGIESTILFEPDVATESPDLPDLVAHAQALNIKLVVFQKVHGASVLRQARRLAAAGIKTMYAVCDLVCSEMAHATHATILVTSYLKSLYPPELQSKLHVVHDGIEHPEVVKSSWRNDGGSRSKPLDAILVTSMQLDHLPVLGKIPDWLRVSIVGNYPPSDALWLRLRQAKWMFARQPDLAPRLAFLKFLADRRIRRIAWNPVTVYEELKRADLGIIPINRREQSKRGVFPPAWQVKSENRLTLKMSIGLPVIATPIPSYESVIEQGRNGFLAESRNDWLGCLDQLRDPKLRRSIGEKARASVLQRYSMEEQARRFLLVIENLIRKPNAKELLGDQSRE